MSYDSPSAQRARVDASQTPPLSRFEVAPQRSGADPMRRRRIRADARGMETRTGRFQRTHRFTQTRRGLKAELLALRYELELLDEALRAAGTPAPARVALDYAFTHLRAAEHAWQEMCRPADLRLIITQIDASRDALEAAVTARAGRLGASATDSPA